ncbi:CoA pyrophosphatase [Gammaproteobacteria bacterium]|nr:CoA pyrophosphatase [Gammaproteobacteria bacterium]
MTVKGVSAGQVCLNRLEQYFTEQKLEKEIFHPDPTINSLAHKKKTGLKNAAVLIAASPENVDLTSSIILTLRSQNLNSHAGQVSLPGGTTDASDINAVDTALREAQEEVSLGRNRVKVLGCLGKIALPSGYLVTPVVGLIDSFLNLTPFPDEVDEIFSVPLTTVLDPNAYKTKVKKTDSGNHQILEIQYNGYRIWGATAAILYHLANEIENNIKQKI